MSDWSDDESSAAAPKGGAPARGGGGGDSGCRKCGEEGHMSRDCTQPDVCKKCKQEGHMARDCEIPDKCRKCNEEGHMARDCEIPDKCRKCNEEGHMARDCELPDTCKRCGEEGHMVAECSQAEQTRTITAEDGTVREIYVPKETGDAELYDEVHTISSGINFDKYETIEVKMEGENVPQKMESFDACGLRPLVVANVKKSNYTKPTPVQKNAIPVILAKRDLSLTEGALARVMRCENVASLVVQVLETEPIPNGRFSLLVSDGAFSSFNTMLDPMLDPKLNHLIQEKKLENFTIVKIKDLIYSSHKVKGKKILFIILMEIEVITPGAEVGRKIGSPVQIPSDGSAPPPPSNQNKDPNVGAVKRPAETSSVAPPPAKVPANNSNRGEYYSAIATVSYFTKDKSLYKACPNQVDGRDCNKKMQENGDGTYRCEKCSTNLTNYKWRLILSMNIGDSSEGIWSTCFQETAEKMLGMSSEEVGNLL